MFNKIGKWCKVGVLIIWSIVLAASIYTFAAGESPRQMSWLDVFCHEGTIVSLALAEVIRDDTFLF